MDPSEKATSVSELFPRTRRLVFNIETQINCLEKGHASAEDVSESLKDLDQHIYVLANAIKRERLSQRENWKKKLRELESEKSFLEDQFQRHISGKVESGREAREREELLARRRTTLPRGAVDNLVQEGSSLQRSSKMVHEYIHTGREALSNLTDQRSRLKNAQRRVLDISNIMGLSSSILRMSERRNFVDKLILIGGMTFILILLYWAWSRTTP